MSQNKYQRRNNSLVPRSNSIIPVSRSSIPNIFNNNNTTGREMSKGRIHCVAIRKTAIYKDSNGNKIVLKEDQHAMNVPIEYRGRLEYKNGKNKWSRK